MTNARNTARNNDIDLKAEFAALARENEALKAANAKLEREAKGPLAYVIEAATVGYARVNAEAIAAEDDPLANGTAPELRDHFDFRQALERVLDGIGQALDGFTTAKGQSYPGLNQVAIEANAKIERERGAEPVMLTDGKPAEKHARDYYRMLDAAEMAASLEALRNSLMQAYDIAAPATEYLPLSERIKRSAAAKAAKAEETARAATNVDALLAKIRARRG